MARAPVTRKRIGTVEPGDDMPDEMSAVVRADDAADADSVADVLEDLRAILTEETKILVFKKPPKGGQWEYMSTLSPPINADTLHDELKDEYGGGEYQLRVFARGKVVKIKRTIIGGPPKIPGQAPEVRRENMSELLPLIMNTQQGAADRQSQMMQMMMTMMQTSAQQSQNQMMTFMQAQQAQSQQSQQMLMGLAGTLAPLLLGNKVDPVQQMAALMTAMREANPKSEEGGGIKDTLAIMAAVKEFMGESGGEGGDFLTNAMKGLAPILGKVVENMPAQTGAPPPQQVRQPPQYRPLPQIAPPGSGPFAGPPSPDAPPLAAPDPKTLTELPDGETVETWRLNPVLAVIGEDVLFFARRGYDPELAAEAVLERIEQAQVAQNDLMALVFRFNAAEDWIADLARDGLDLSASREWAESFISSLVAQYTEGDAEEDDNAGRVGSETDAPHDGEGSAQGE
jgi:hypothetical protein